MWSAVNSGCTPIAHHDVDHLQIHQDLVPAHQGVVQQPVRTAAGLADVGQIAVAVVPHVRDGHRFRLPRPLITGRDVALAGLHAVTQRGERRLDLSRVPGLEATPDEDGGAALDPRRRCRLIEPRSGRAAGRPATAAPEPQRGTPRGRVAQLDPRQHRLLLRRDHPRDAILSIRGHVHDPRALVVISSHQDRLPTAPLSARPPQTAPKKASTMAATPIRSRLPRSHPGPALPPRPVQLWKEPAFSWHASFARSFPTSSVPRRPGTG